MGARTLGARNGMHMPGARSVLRAKNASVPTPNENESSMHEESGGLGWRREGRLFVWPGGGNIVGLARFDQLIADHLHSIKYRVYSTVLVDYIFYGQAY